MATTKTLQVAEPAGIIAGKNAIINGAMDIWQRGTSFTAAGFVSDRWYLNSDGGIATTTVRSTDAPTGFRYSIKMQRNSGNTGTGAHGIGQAIETSESIRFAGKTVTYSFWAKKGANYSAASNLLEWRVGFSTGTDQSITTAYGGWAGYSEANSPAATLTTSWQRFTMTFNVPVGTTQISVRVFQAPVGTAGADDSYYITGFQFEEGNVATPFSRAGGTYQGELAACQRYYFRTGAAGSVYGHIAFGMSFSTTALKFDVTCPVTLRALPSSVEWANLQVNQPGGGGGSGAPSAITINTAESTFNIINLDATKSGITALIPYYLINNNNASGYLGFSAEL